MIVAVPAATGITTPFAVTRAFVGSEDENVAAARTFFRDSNLADSTSDYVKAFNAFKTPRTYGYLVIRVADRKWSDAWTAGDRVSVYRFIADIITDDTEGDDSVKFTVNFLPQGLLYPAARVAAAGAISGVDPRRQSETS